MLSRAFGVDPEALRGWLPWMVALHDIGKISADFQGQNEAQKTRMKAERFQFGRSNNLNHGIIGQVLLWFEAKEKPEIPLSGNLRLILREVIGGHHGQFNAPGDIANARTLIKKDEPEEWARLRMDAAALLKNVLLINPPQSWPEPANISAAIMALTGFTILCDWIGSNSDFFKPQPNTNFENYRLAGRSLAHQAVLAAGFQQDCRSSSPVYFQSLFANLPDPRPLQLAIDAIPADILSSPCLSIIEAPTGEGKTEAALALAHRLAKATGTDELYYALPTTATSNQMFLRLQYYLREQLKLPVQVKLVHSQAFLVIDDFRIAPLSNGDQAISPALEWFGPKKRALLAPFGVGTVDQAELGVLNVRHTALRLVGLAGKVLILDEVHAYDTYMTTIIERLLNWLAVLGTSVILLSATLPKSRRLALARAYCSNKAIALEAEDAYPCLWVVSQEGNFYSNPPAHQLNRSIKTNFIHLDDDQPENKAQWLLDQVKDGGCVCWISNTVQRAQRIFEQLDKTAPEDVERSLLHSQFTLDERIAREQELAQKYGPTGDRPKKGIVIGTQVLEQSLDIDFDLMISDLAPIDLLLQRAGRLHRHAHHLRPPAHAAPQLWINTPMNTNGEPALVIDSYIYTEYILMLTWQVMHNRSMINLPADYRVLIEAVYDAAPPDNSHPLATLWKKMDDQQAKDCLEARLRLLPLPRSAESFCGESSRLKFEENENSSDWIIAQTRLGEESLTVVPLERHGDQACLPGDDHLIDLNQPASRELQFKLLHHSMRISNRSAVYAIKAAMSQLPHLFADSPLLKECLPLWLDDFSAEFEVKKGLLTLRLDERLGLVVSKKGR